MNARAVGGAGEGGRPAADIPRLQAALAGFEDRLRAHKAPFVLGLQPGLSSAALDATTAGLPFKVPAEVRAWFTWHDGADWAESLPFGGSFHSLQQALRAREILLDSQLPDVDQYPEEYISPDWLPIIEYGPWQICVDCGGAEDDVSTVLGVNAWDERPNDEPIVVSMLDMVELWNWLMDQGLWRYDAVAGEWDRTTRSRYPPDAFRSPIA